MFSLFYFLPAGSARRVALSVLFLPTGRFLDFSPAGATRCNHQGDIWQGGADHRSAPVPNFTLIGSGVGFYSPKTEKHWDFTNNLLLSISGGSLARFCLQNLQGGLYACPQLHKSAKCGCFISINDKIINNLPRLGVFS